MSVWGGTKMSNDLKEFLDALRKRVPASEKDKQMFDVIVDDLGLFFWGRGGKQFVIAFDRNKDKFTINGFIGIAKRIILMKDEMVDTDSVLWSRDFLDCVDCLGEEKIKELIKELSGASSNGTK
jgi:hypothetical protein